MRCGCAAVARWLRNTTLPMVGRRGAETPPQKPKQNAREQQITQYPRWGSNPHLLLVFFQDERQVRMEASYPLDHAGVVAESLRTPQARWAQTWPLRPRKSWKILGPEQKRGESGGAGRGWWGNPRPPHPPPTPRRGGDRGGRGLCWGPTGPLQENAQSSPRKTNPKANTSCASGLLACTAAPPTRAKRNEQWRHSSNSSPPKGCSGN